MCLENGIHDLMFLLYLSIHVKKVQFDVILTFKIADIFRQKKS